MVGVRDVRRDESYFSKGIDFKQEIINKGKGRIYLRPEGQALHVSELFDNAVHLLIQRYGRGDSLVSLQGSIQQALDMRKLMVNTLEEMKPEHPTIVKMYNGLDFYNYYDTLTVLCFVVAVSDSLADITYVMTLFEYKGQDALFDRIGILLGGVSDSENISKKLLFPKVYTLLLAVIDAPTEQRPILMKEFIEGWYKSLRAMAWYGNDNAGEGAYFGYWCFEAALVVNLLKIDDSIFRDNIYYPKDLVLIK